MVELKRGFERALKLSKSFSFGAVEEDSFLLSHIIILISKKIFCGSASNRLNDFYPAIDECLSFLTNIKKSGDIGLEVAHQLPNVQQSLQNLKDEEDDILMKILSFTVPPRGSEQYLSIRYALLLGEASDLTLCHIRSVALASVLFPVRQKVGSCFASSLTIDIQENQKHNFLLLIKSILQTGKLEFTFSGVKKEAFLFNRPTVENFPVSFIESASLIEGIPLVRILVGLLSGFLDKDKIDEILLDFSSSLSKEHYGITFSSLLDKMDQFLMKYQVRNKRSSFERGFKISLGRQRKDKASIYVSAISSFYMSRMIDFVLASFSESSGNMLVRNLITSLGWDVSVSGGMAEHLMKYLNERLEYITEELNYNINMYNHIEYSKYLQAQNAEGRSKGSASFLTVTIKELRDKQNIVVNLFNNLYNAFAHMLPLFFIELYNPSLLASSFHEYMQADSKAGFTLIFRGSEQGYGFKEIASDKDFVTSLYHFLSMNESRFVDEILGNDANIHESEEIRIALKCLIDFVNAPSFAHGCFMRIAKLFGVENLDFSNPDRALALLVKENITPWSYPSGGSPVSLLKNVYNITGKLSVIESSDISNAQDILEFWKKASVYVNDSASLIAVSPTHAFRIFPSVISSFSAEDSLNILKHSLFDSRWLSESIFGELASNLAVQYSFVKDTLRNVNSMESLHEGLFLLCKSSKLSRRIWHSFVYSKIFSLTQMISIEDAVNNSEELIAELAVIHKWSQHDQNMLLSNATDLIKGGDSSLILLKEVVQHVSKVTKEDISVLHKRVQSQHQSAIYIHKNMILGDTNWDICSIVFVKNMLTGNLEVWAFNNSCTEGMPILDWNNQISKKLWAVFNRPSEYNKHFAEQGYNRMQKRKRV